MQHIQPEPIVSVAMLGARMHFAVPTILADAGLLHTLYTDTYLGNKLWLRNVIDLPPKILRPKAVRRLYERNANRIPANRVVSFDRLGLSYFLRRRRTRTSAALTRLFARVNAEFGNSVVRAGLNDSQYIMGFNGAALEIFTHARERGIKCILEQAIAPRAAELVLMAEEVRRWPDWMSGWPSDVDPIRDPLAQRERAEWQLADKIICGSEFVAAGLRQEGVSAEKLSVVPYGVDTDFFKPNHEDRASAKLNVLFVGEVGLRKGAPYLLEALRLLNQPQTIHARLVGPLRLSSNRLREYSNWCEIAGPLPRGQARDLYQWADVLVLPSICEGSATVTYEALACGLPVITTCNSGSVVRDGVDGFIVPIRDVTALSEAIARLQQDVGLRDSMAQAAREQASNISLEAYAGRLLKSLF
jgi:glycosyltransferase involved in cell wall biosynthesis